MSDYVARPFANEIVHLDGATFIDCEFRNATLVYSGGELPSFMGCHFDSCAWTFEGHALRTLAYLKRLVSEHEGFHEAILRELGTECRCTSQDRV